MQVQGNIMNTDTDISFRHFTQEFIPADIHFGAVQQQGVQIMGVSGLAGFPQRQEHAQVFKNA